MKLAISRVLRKTPLRSVYHRLKAILPGSGQSNEAEIVLRLAKGTPTFVEFGFHPTEFNCIGLSKSYQGLLIDSDTSTVKLARSILPKNIEVRESFLTLDNISFIATHFPSLGVLSVDVDGNDYWFLEHLLYAKPEVIVVEYNASFGLESITVPYDTSFDRHQKHPTGWYHGASLIALEKLCARAGYGLAAVAEGGGNAFFTRDGTLNARTAYRPNRLRDRWSRTTPAEQWTAVQNLPFVEV
jgi:hypothetical protein